MAAVRYHTESIPSPTTAPKAAAHTVFCFLECPRVSREADSISVLIHEGLLVHIAQSEGRYTVRRRCVSPVRAVA